MSSIKLKDRISSYQELSDYKLLNRVPLIISLNGRGFSKITELLDKPYCPKFTECILSTTFRLCSEIEGALFAYQYNDEIVIIVKNDQGNETSPWYDNKLQKLCSVVASVATLHFSDYAKKIDLNINNDPIFISKIFVVPNEIEAINTMIFKQQQNFHIAVQMACFYELLKKYDKHAIKDMLSGLSIDEKIDLLYQECGIDYNKYPIYFRRGAACYKVPKIVDDTMKNKWTINTELPIFSKDQSFISNIMKNGADIFRKESF